MSTPTQKLSDVGVSIWLDDLSRDRIQSGSLQNLIATRNVVGVTTNPTIFASVQKTGRLVIAHEAPTNVSISSEIAARVAEHNFYNLEAPVLRVGGFDTPYPPSKLEEAYLPDADRILEAIDRIMAY